MAVPLNTINGQRILEDEDDYEPTHDGSFISIFRLFSPFATIRLFFDLTQLYFFHPIQALNNQGETSDPGDLIPGTPRHLDCLWNCILIFLMDKKFNFKYSMRLYDNKMDIYIL